MAQPAPQTKPKNNLAVKIGLDIVMALVLVLLYNSHVLLLTFHEVAGLAILGVFLIHILLNRKWVVNVGKKLFSPSTPARTKFSYWMTILLVISFILIVISGLMISKVLLKEWFEAAGIERNKDFWRDMHEFCSAISIILVGIHLGLYWDMVKGFFKKRTNYGAIASRVFTVILAAMLVWGVICIPTAGVTEWLLAPVTENTYHGKNKDQQTDAAQTTEGQNGDVTAADNTTDENVERSDKGEWAGKDDQTEAERGDADTTVEDEQAADRTEGEQAAGQAEGEAARDGQQGDDSQKGQNDSEEKSHSHGGKRTISIPNIFLVISQYSSIIAVFATVTYAIDHTLKKRRRASKEN